MSILTSTACAAITYTNNHFDMLKVTASTKAILAGCMGFTYLHYLLKQSKDSSTSDFSSYFKELPL